MSLLLLTRLIKRHQLVKMSYWKVLILLMKGAYRGEQLYWNTPNCLSLKDTYLLSSPIEIHTLDTFLFDQHIWKKPTFILSIVCSEGKNVLWKYFYILCALYLKMDGAITIIMLYKIVKLSKVLLNHNVR